jgi:hypothetical protein
VTADGKDLGGNMCCFTTPASEWNSGSLWVRVASNLLASGRDESVRERNLVRGLEFRRFAAKGGVGVATGWAGR